MDYSHILYENKKRSSNQKDLAHQFLTGGKISVTYVLAPFTFIKTQYSNFSYCKCKEVTKHIYALCPRIHYVLEMSLESKFS